MGHFTFWISLLLRPKTETKRLNFGLSPELRLTNHCSAHSCSLHNILADVIADISVFLCLFMNQPISVSDLISQNLISNRLTYLVHAKSTSELISFGFSDRSVRSLDSAKRSANHWVIRWVQMKKNDFTFWLIFGLSPNLGLSESFSERLIQKVKWPVVLQPRRGVSIMPQHYSWHRIIFHHPLLEFFYLCLHHARVASGGTLCL